MQEGRCPKCGSDEVYKQGHYMIRIRRFVNVPRVIYACAECGYCEQYIEDPRLDDIKKHWIHVPTLRKRKNDES